MGYVIRNEKIQEARKVTLTSTQRKKLQKTTAKQKEMIERIEKRKFLRVQNHSAIA